MTRQLLFRKLHRYLGVFIGIQFVAWSISGLYFSWSDIDKVHGDHMVKAPDFLQHDVAVVSPSIAIDSLKQKVQVDSIHSIRLINVVDKPVYHIAYFSGHAGMGMHLHVHHSLADARTGGVRRTLSQSEAEAVATQHVATGATRVRTEYLPRIEADHEYRERPLPAWAVSFSNPDCTIYISAEQGTYQAVRNDQWRTFDFLWMFHTMDYSARDNINNGILRALSVLALLTVVSGFTLYFMSSQTFRKAIKLARR